MRVTAILVNHNTRELLAEALHSLPSGIETIVVDNASTDGSAGAVRSEFPGVRLIENSENLGYAKAVNQAVRIATGDAFLLLNSDATLEGGALEALVSRLLESQKAAAVGARLLGPDGRLQPSTYAPLSLGVEVLQTLRAYRWLPRKTRADLFLGSRWDHGEPRSVGRISGTCLLVRRKAWEQVGSLSERFFIYGEIHDWCERARRRGWEIWFEPGALARHRLASTAKKLWPEPERVLRIWDSHYRLLESHKGRWQAWIFALNYLVSNGLAWLKVALVGAKPEFRERLAAEMWAHLGALAPAVLGKPGQSEPASRLMVLGTQRLATIVGAKFLAIFYMSAMARRLGRGGLGVAMLVVGLSDLSSLLASGNLQLAVAKFLSDPRERANRGAILGAACISLFSSSCLFLIPFLFFPGAVASLYGAPQMTELLGVGGALMVSSLWCAFFMAWHQGFQEITLMSKLELAQSALTALGVLAWLPFGTVPALLKALVGANLASLVVWIGSSRRLLKKHGVRVSFEPRSAWGKVLGYSLPATLSAVASWPQFWAVTTLLKRRSSFGAVGLFSVAFQLPRNIIVFSQALAAPYLPLVSWLEAESGARLARVVAKVQRGLAASAFPPGFVFALLAVPILRVLYGPEFRPAWDAFILLCAAWYLRALNDAVTQYLAGTGRQWRALGYNLCNLGVLLGACYALSPSYAAFGAAGAFVLAYGSYMVISVLTLRSDLGIRLLSVLELAGVPMLFFLSSFWIAPRLLSPAGLLGGAAALALAGAWTVKILTDREPAA